MALVAKTIVDGKVTEWEFGDAGGLKIHICTSSEYSLVSREPVIASPDEKTLYLVPAEDGDTSDLFDEWAYVDDSWEKFGAIRIGSIDYTNLYNKPSINGVTLSGNKTSTDLNIPTAEDLSDMVDDWLDENISNPDSPPLDRSLSSSSAAAPADLVGEELTSIKEDLSEIVPGLSDAAKEALLTCFEKVAWIDEHGQDYYDALYEALYNEEPPTPDPDVPEGYTKYDWIKVDNLDSVWGQDGILRSNQILLPITGNKNLYHYETDASDYIGHNAGQCIFGGRDTNGATDSLAFYISDNGTTIAFQAHGEQYISSTLSVLTINKCHITFNPSVNPSVADVGGTTVTRAWASTSQTMSAQLALFGNPAPGSGNDIYATTKFKLGRFKVYDGNNNVICDCIPCSNANGKYGMYDKISQQFLTSTANDTYVCGNWA